MSVQQIKNMEQRLEVLSNDFSIFWDNYGLLILLVISITVFLSWFKEYSYRKKVKLDDLEALGLAQEVVRVKSDSSGASRQVITDRVLRLRYLENKVIFTKYNRKKSPKDFEALKDNLEHIWQEKICKIESKKRIFGQNHIICYFERFIEGLQFEDIEKPPKHSFTIGLDPMGNRINQDAKNDGEITLAIWGAKGSGKTVAAKSVIRSFFQNNPEHELIIFDYKVSDFLDLAYEQNSFLFNLSDDSELKSGFEYLKSRVAEHQEYKNQLLRENENCPNWLDLKRKDKPRPFFLLFDEAQQYLSKKNIPKITKDSSEEEKKRVERLNTEKELAFLIDHIAAVHRAYGNCMVICSQDSRAGTYNFDFTNFKTMLISQQNAQQSLALTGSQVASDKSLKKGKFIYLSDKITKVQIPETHNLEVPQEYIRKGNYEYFKN